MPGKIIDIGVGRNPYFLRFRTHCDAEEYVGVDTNAERLEVARKILQVPSPFRAPASAQLVTADASQLPFADGSFTTAVLSNILSAPIHKDWDLYSPDHDVKSLGNADSFYRERKKVTAEALRVLGRGGKLRIYTDLIIYGQHSYDMILRELRNDPRLRFEVLQEEQERIDQLNMEKISSGDYCYCFLGDLLPSASVYEATKL